MITLPNVKFEEVVPKKLNRKTQFCLENCDHQVALCELNWNENILQIIESRNFSRFIFPSNFQSLERGRIFGFGAKT